jgi:phosphoglycerate dehydrogenase-like enzyme
MGLPRVLVVTIPGMIGADDLAGLRAHADVEYREMKTSVSESDLARLCDGHDYLMLNYDVIKNLGESFYESPHVRSLKAIAADITGMDWASPHAAAANGVPLLNIPHYSTESVAETTLTEVLLHSRRRHAAYVDEIRGREIKERRGINLAGRTAGVVGLGSIGSRVAELLAGIGMDVVAWSRTPRAGVTMISLPELFKTAGVICVCAKTVTQGPERNVHMIDESLLRHCDQTIIVNLANFNLVDHEAMAEAVITGKVAGYTVERTPPMLASPLADLDAVHLAPTDAWSSEESLQALRENWVGNILAAIDGRLQNVYRD